MTLRRRGEQTGRMRFVPRIGEGAPRGACLFFLIATLLVRMPGAARAEDPEPVRWSVQEAVAYALGNNPELAVAHNKIDELVQQRGVVFSNYLPDVNFEASYRYIDNVPRIDVSFDLPSTTPGVPPSTITRQVVVGANDNAAIALKFNQLLFGSGRVYYADRAMKKQVASGEYQEDSVKLGVARQTAEVYYRVQILDKVVGVQREALHAAQAHCDQVQHRRDAGAATLLELLRSQVEVSNLDAAATEAEKNHESALTLLRRVTGLPEDVPVTLTGAIITTSVGRPDPDHLVRNAYDSRPELKALEESQTAAEDKALSERGWMLPTLNLFGNFTYQNPYFAIVEWEQIFTVGVGIQVPLFDGLSAYRKMREARAVAETVSLTAAQTRADVRKDIDTAFLDLKEAEVRIRTTDENQGRATRMLSIAESTYAAGAATSLEVIDAQLAATRARLEHLKALYDYRIACVRLAWASGDLEGIWREEPWQNESSPSS